MKRFTRQPRKPAPYVPRGRAAIAPPPPAARATAGVLSRFSKQFGSGVGELAARWPEIVGEKTARLCTPIKLTGRNGEGALHLAARGPGALLVEAESASILERVNTYAGRTVAKRIAITRAPAAAPASSTPARKKLTATAEPKRFNLSPTQKLALEAELKDIDDPRLRAALFKLGTAARADAARRS
ncbi:MAG: DciA family protein [Maricaulaceae bacterium]|jgi:hypothetical protein